MVLQKSLKISALVSQSQKFGRAIKLFLLVTLSFGLVYACGGNLPQNSALPGSPLPTSECRMVKHAMGETCVPANPRRVVALTNDAVGSLLSLDVQPVGAISNLVSVLADKLKDAESVGVSNQVNLEKILALNPDLILASKYKHEAVYDEFSKIAPTIVEDVHTPGEWKEVFALHAEALGMTNQGKQLMDEYEKRLENFKAQMGERLKQTKVSLVRIYPNQIGLYLKNSFAGTILEEIGLPRPASQDKGIKGQQPFQIVISKERIRDADGDVIFVWTFGAPPEVEQSTQEALRKLKADPLWSQLSAVELGKVYEVGHYWNVGSPMTANLILNDLFNYLVEG